MLKNIKAVAFDIDGTLYPASSLNIRLIPYVIRHLFFYLHYNKVRNILHRTAPLPDFYEYQARLFARETGCTPGEAKSKITSIVYDGLKKYFKKIKPFKNVDEAFRLLKEKGYKIALLSDFPPEQKGDVWGLASCCDCVLGTEQIGALKPSKYPFGVLALSLKLNPEEILYVGNSVKYDLIGAKNAGMKTAVIACGLKKIFNKKLSQADVVFSNYRQFIDILLK